jgi:hypothetical protein
MDVLFKSRLPEAVSQRDEVIRRLRFATRRVGSLVRQARISIEDLNGPRGGIDKRCRIELYRSRAGQPIIVTSAATDWRSAFEDALPRAVQALLQRHDRLRRGVRTLRPLSAPAPV